MAGDEWVEVIALAELPPGEVKAAEAGGRRLALVNLEGVVHALDGVCPHRGGPLAEGAIWGGHLECPWHHFCYDPATGANVYPANVYPSDLPSLQEQLRAVRVFPVRVCGGRVFVRLDQPAKG